MTKPNSAIVRRTTDVSTPVPDPTRFTAEELRLLYRVAAVLLREQDYGELLASLLDVTIEAFGGDRGCVVVSDQAGFHTTVARNFRSDALGRTEQQISTTIAGLVMREGRTFLEGDAQTSELLRGRKSIRELGMRSVMCAPVLTNRGVVALLYLENRDVGHRFSERQRVLMDEICALSAPRLSTAIAMEVARRQARELEGALGGTDGILTADSQMAAVLETLRQVAATDLSVIIQGETGTGKELVARALYRRSRRAQGAFVILNCAAIPSTLIESELFGYLRGAFTGAVRDRVGLIGAAHRGTLFLDEIGELPLDLQPKLLRVLESGEFTPLGSAQRETADVRFVAATNRDLEHEVQAGRFRSDLYYRLSAITLRLPPLRDRPADVPLLAGHFLRGFAARYGKGTLGLSDECVAALCRYPFPGNVRELENEIARLVALSPAGGVVPAEALTDRIRGSRSTADAPSAPLSPMPLAEMERRLILSVLQTTRGNRKRAAEVLGISREGLRTKMQRLGIAAAADDAATAEG